MITNLCPEGIEINSYFYKWAELSPKDYCYYINGRIKEGDKHEVTKLFP